MTRYLRIHRTSTVPVTEGQEKASPVLFLEKLVAVAASVLLILLAFRFLLALLGANSGNWFAHFVYSVSYPFVAPFFGLFNYNYTYGVSRVEMYTLVAMVVYAVAAWIITALIDLGRHDDIIERV